MRTIISKIVAGAILVTSATAMTVPASARYNDRDGYYDSRYDNYYEGRRDYRGDYRRDRGYREYRNDRREYRNDRRDRNYYRGQRCDKGTGGTIIGAIAGGLLGHEVVGRRGDKTAGTIIGAGVGALAGRAIDRSDGRRC